MSGTEAGNGRSQEPGKAAAQVPSGFIPPHGGYRNLLSYRKAEIVYDATVRFTERFLDRRDRTVDQMVQAARSGKQNIVEGSQISGTSKEAEIKLINVARASQEELLADYADYLRVRDLALWTKDSGPTKAIRRLAYTANESYEISRTYIENRTAGTVANIVICLIHQTNYLLDRQLRQLEKAFLAEGGLRERMTQARLRSGAAQRADERR
jgi:four helix bundle suffix protein